MLTDDVLLCILGRVSSRMAVRTSVLSKRWKYLPWLLPELTIDVKDFLPDPCPDPVEAKHIEEAMVSLTKATRTFLANQQRESTVSNLDIRLYLINTFLCEIGSLVGDAVDGGLLKEFELSVHDQTDPRDCSDENMLQRAEEIDRFFSAYPSVVHCLTWLSLQNVNFGKLDMNHVLLDCCKELKHLSLYQCDTGMWSLFRIDAPSSKICVLELIKCRFGRLEVVCLPKLEKLSWDTWVSECAPLAFGSVPSLEELELSCGAICDQHAFKLSELLHGTTSIHTLTLDFQGEKLWVLPEMKQLSTAFNKLRELRVRGIFVEFDILWTSAFLVAAPSIEVLQIEVWEHPCDVDDAREGSFSERKSPHWEMDFHDSKNLLLKELEIVGFKSLEQQFTFIRSVLEQSPNLQKIVLREAEKCDYCDDAFDVPSKFPKKDEQDKVAGQIRDGMFSPQIIFDE
uniref:Uncharacterized protein n=1 Tax=Avena sativa TaxID=4498 RepID=A0ACD5WCS7_AVESA